MAGGKVHGQGGHGRFSRELQRGYASRLEAEEKIKRAQEANARKFEARVEREIEAIKLNTEKTVFPIVTKARTNLELRARRGGLGGDAFVIRMLALDEYVVGEIRKRFEANEIIKPYSGEVNYGKFRWLPDEDRTRLFTLVLGKNPSVQKQRRILGDIRKFCKDVPRWALGTV
jgi:hypothetical protein